jgi:hypothetical protein
MSDTIIRVLVEGPQGPQGQAGSTDHSALSNLTVDTHPQYLTNGRGDARYSPLGHTHPSPPPSPSTSARKFYDASIDGVTGDNTPTAAALQRAINNAIALGYRDLLLPEGDINLEQGVHIWGGQVQLIAKQPMLLGLRIWGQGLHRTRLRPASGVVALWWHTSNNYLADPGTNSQPSQMREFGGGHFSIIGGGITSGTVGIRIGGMRPNQPDVMENKVFEDVLIDQVTSCWQDDDSTNTVLRMFSIGVFKYGFEHGYNCDNFLWESGYFGHEDPTLLEITASGISAAGSNTFSFPDAGGSDGVKISQKIDPGWVVNAPGIFPHGTYVKTVASNGVTCTVTTQDYTGANATSLAAGNKVSFLVGRVHVYGSDAYAASTGPYPKDSSPWTPPFWGSGKGLTTQGRENGNALKHGQVCGGRIERFLDAGGGSHHNLSCNNVYTERIAGFAKLGRTGGSQIPQSTHFVECYPNAPQHLTAPWVAVLSENVGGLIVVKNNNLDAFSGGAGVSGTQPWVSIPTYGSWTLVWENNGLPVSASGTAPQIKAFTDDIGPPSNQLVVGDCVYSASPRKGSAKMLLINQPVIGWAFTCQDMVELRLNQACQVNNPFYEHGGLENREVTFKLVQDATGGRAVTFQSNFLNTNGAALGVVTGGAANTVAALTFRFVNGKYRLQAPVFWA